MKNEREISMDYNRAMRMTRDLRDAAGRFRSLVNEDVTNQLNSLSCGWKGENAERFLSKAFNCFRDASDAADYIERLADMIARNARAVYNAEMTALRIARERRYNSR